MKRQAIVNKGLTFEIFDEETNEKAPIIAKNMIVALKQREYSTYSTYVNAFEAMKTNPKYSKSADLFQIIVPLMRKIEYVASTDVKQFDKILGGVFQSFSTKSFGEGLLDRGKVLVAGI